MTAAALVAAMAAAIAVLVLGGRVAVVLQASRATATEPSGAFGLARRRRRGRAPSPDVVADWCDHAARELRSGASLTAAVANATASQPAMSPVTGPILRRVSRGHALLDAFDVADASTAAGLALAVLRSCARFGGPAAAPLERAAATLRSRQAIAAEQQAQSAQARLSARVLTVVPIGLLALLAASDPKVRAAIGTPAGLTAVALGAALNAVGALWMRRIIGRPV
jgi:tight adherence protein B